MDLPIACRKDARPGAGCKPGSWAGRRRALDNHHLSLSVLAVAPKHHPSSANSPAASYTPKQLAEFRRKIRVAIRWAEAKGLDVMPNCWSLGTLYGLKGCAQLGFCCPLGATVLRRPPQRIQPDSWTCGSAAFSLGASEAFVTGFITGYEGHTLQHEFNAQYIQGYRMGGQFRRSTQSANAPAPKK